MTTHAPLARPQRAPHPAAVLFLVLVVVCVGVVTLGPRSLVLGARIDAVEAINALLGRVDLSLTTMEVEDLANVLLFVPLGAAVSAVLPRRAWLLAVPICVAVTAAVETAQSVLPGRVPDLSDVVLNSVGAAVGCAGFALLRALFTSPAAPRGRGGRAAE